MAVGLAGVCELIFLLFFRETYKVTILRRRAANLRKETGDQSYKTEYDADMDNPWKTIAYSMLRPAKVIWSSVVLQMLSWWGGLGYKLPTNTTGYEELVMKVYTVKRVWEDGTVTLSTIYASRQAADAHVARHPSHRYLIEEDYVYN